MPGASYTSTPSVPPAALPQPEPEPADRFQIAVQSARGALSELDWLGLTAQQRTAAIYAHLRRLDAAGHGNA